MTLVYSFLRQKCNRREGRAGGRITAFAAAVLASLLWFTPTAAHAELDIASWDALLGKAVKEG
ncbi:MAG: hypothetical protein ACPG1A_14070, partial [Halioglobus sp.]